MEFATKINLVLVSVVFGLIGLIYKLLSARVEKNNQSVQDVHDRLVHHMLEDVKTYATKADLEAHKVEIGRMVSDSLNALREEVRHLRTDLNLKADKQQR